MLWEEGSASSMGMLCCSDVRCVKISVSIVRCSVGCPAFGAGGWEGVDDGGGLGLGTPHCYTESQAAMA